MFAIEDLVVIGRLGRAVGLSGGLKFILEGDFVETLACGACVHLYQESALGQLTMSLHVARFEPKKSLIFFEEVQTLEKAKELTNLVVAMTQEESLKRCALQEGEFLYFQLLGLEVVEGGVSLGQVVRIERLANTDYLFVQNPQKLFLIPYIPHYIQQTDLQTKRIYTHNASGLLEES
ncbi:ribosome maturation factor RimM [Helicobacter cynogastricus]|uniref:ribosome maturation factor RimM n=1 Tax=Helicobacter cynogastricus TaxID=329937 RepID=UPI000CF18845|nr:ribosome maturation factor RimM [Helicobacter cynogastricus]